MAKKRKKKKTNTTTDALLAGGLGAMYGGAINKGKGAALGSSFLGGLALRQTRKDEKD